MSRSDLNLNPIREKLMMQKRQLNLPDSSGIDVDWDAPNPEVQNPGAQATYQQTVEMLQQRSGQSPGTSATPTARADHLELHRHRLLAIAEHINELSLQQERAMVEIRQIGERIAREQHLFQGSSDRSAALATWLDTDNAIVAWVESEEDGGLFLAYRPVKFDQEHHTANQVAQALRQQTARRRSHRSADPTLGPDILWAEPLTFFRSGWQALTDGLATWLSTATTPSARPRLTPMDGAMWFGGGVISRLALNLILAAYPGLWSIAVAIVTAITAYALYRATLAPRLDFSLAYRVLLAVAGLILGGHL